MLKFMSLAAAGAVIGLSMAVGPHSSADNQLSSLDLASIRGASPPGCIQSILLYGCVNPRGYAYDSTCINCSTVTNQERKTSIAYPIPGRCATTGTAYKNFWYRTCSQTGSSNNLICSTGQMDCTWPVSRNEGTERHDFSCDATYKCTVAAPPVEFEYNGELWEERTSCRDCSTGAPAGAGLISVTFGSCVQAQG